jgi:ABC-type glycerol-3-phosphate transport system substrate-binding protein
MATTCQGQAPEYAALGGSVALDTYVQSSHWGYSGEELRDFFSTALAADYLPQFQAYYSWPSYRSMDVLYYNEDWLAQLGHESPPETWDEFAEISCTAVEQPFLGMKGEGAILGYEYVTSARRLATLIRNHGGNFITRNGAAYAFNSPEVLAALTFLKDITGRGCADSTTERSGDQRDFSEGRVLFTISATDHLPDYRDAVIEGAGFRWSVSPPPRSADRDGPRMNLYGTSQCVFRSTPERQLAAWLYIKWMSEPEQQAGWARGTGHYPARRSAARSMNEYFTENPTYQKAFGFAALDHGIEPPVAGHSRCRPVIEEAFAAVMTSDEPQAALDATVDRCNEFLKEALP